MVALAAKLCVERVGVFNPRGRLLSERGGSDKGETSSDGATGLENHLLKVSSSICSRPKSSKPSSELESESDEGSVLATESIAFSLLSCPESSEVGDGRAELVAVEGEAGEAAVRSSRSLLEEDMSAFKFRIEMRL